MEKVEPGLFVSVHYKGTLQNGEVFDTSEGRHPLEAEMGVGHVFKRKKGFHPRPGGRLRAKRRKPYPFFSPGGCSSGNQSRGGPDSGPCHAGRAASSGPDYRGG